MHTPINRRSFASSLTVSLAAGAWAGGTASLARSEDWTGWRGPRRDGYCESVLPTKLTGANVRELWSVGLGESYSGPLVVGDRVVVTETVDAKVETVKALRRSDGQELWAQQWPGAMSVPFFAKSNGDWIRSTPATNGEVIVVGGMCDVLACLDVQTGEKRWQVDFVKQNNLPLPAFGLVCSPLIDGEHVIVQAGGAVRKLSLATGETLWQALEDGNGMNGGAFSSPVIAEFDGVRQLIVQTRMSLAGVDLENGQVLWTQDIATFRGMNILTPTIWKDCVFTSCYGGRAVLFRIAKSNEGSWTATQVWEAKAEAYMSSPIIVNDHLYMHLRNQRVCCLQLSDGKETWRTTPYGKYWSMVTDGKTILALDEKGVLYTIQPNPEKFELLDEREVAQESSWAHVAVADGQVFVRHLKGLNVLATS